MNLSVSPLNVAVTEREEYIPPCKAMENVRIDYVENNYTIKNVTKDSVGEFWFSIGFRMHKFKEIDQERYCNN